jgi:hypothetical protein
MYFFKKFVINNTIGTNFIVDTTTITAQTCEKQKLRDGIGIKIKKSNRCELAPTF